ncbi:MAG: DUF2024 family protein [Planctomycetales bacterium]|nr:DUF2024 family protein [Planctomycetales bacterium]
MKVDIYDTYATAPDGRLMHFDFHVPAGTSQRDVERLAAKHVGGTDPEIEAERRVTNVLTQDPSVLSMLKGEGFIMQPLHSVAKRAA